ncbi:MAG: hypothetical protein JO227_01765 [Acetobacteraceae bacterium]|nr:hypothetical protein [Acetobacteraceae bacterium]
MPPIEARLKDLLNETRIAMLGVQLLLGLQYHTAFTQMFHELPVAFRALDCVALLLLLGAVGLLLGIPAYHQIVERGHATGRMIGHASAMLKASLTPISIALGMDVAIALANNAGAASAAIAGSVFVAGSLFTWEVFPRLVADQSRETTMEDKAQSVEARLEQALLEIRVILPGSQALFGFQFTAVLTEAFTHLPPHARLVHLLSSLLVAATIVMLIAPAAYHRIAAGGEAEERVLRYAVRMMLPAEALLVLGLAGDAYVTVQAVSGNSALALGVSLAALAGFVALLFIVPLSARSSVQLVPHRRA